MAPRSGLRSSVAALVAGVLAATCLGAPPAAADTRRIVSGWLPGWDNQAALAATTANADLFNQTSPFWYTAKAAAGGVAISSSVTDATVASTVAALHAVGLPVVPSVADGSAARAMAAVLADPTSRGAHVSQLVALVVANGFDGIELDYEKFAFSDGSGTWASTRPNWVAFITELGTALHAVGKTLGLAIPPVYAAGQVGSSGYWVYDPAAIAGSIDSLEIMAYDYSVAAPGPIAPLAFVRKSLAYVATVVPPTKLRLGVPAYGRIWVARRADGSQAITGSCPTTALTGMKSFTAANAATYLAGVAGTPVTPTWSPDQGEQTVTFTRTYTGTNGAGAATSCEVQHVAWWVDTQGTLARIGIADEFGVAGVAFWHLAGVDQATWPAIRAYASGQTQTPTPTPTPSTPVTVVTLSAPASAPAGSRVSVAVRVTSSGGLPAGTRVTLQRRSTGSRKWVKVARANLDATGAASMLAKVGTAHANWRLKIPAATGRPAGLGTATTAVAAVISAKASKRAVPARARVKITGRVTPHARGIRVYLRRLVGGQWSPVRSARTTASGRVSFIVRLSEPRTAYRYRLETAKSSKRDAGASGEIVITTK